MALATSNKVLLAGVLGFAAGILYAPRKGSETQAKLKERMEGMKSEVETKAKRAKSKFEDMRKNKGDKEMDKVDREINETADTLLP